MSLSSVVTISACCLQVVIDLGLIGFVVVLVEVELAKALKNSNFFEVVAKLSTTLLPTLDNFSRLTFAVLSDCCLTLEAKSNDSLACKVNCSMLKKSSWAVTSSKVEAVV